MESLFKVDAKLKMRNQLDRRIEKRLSKAATMPYIERQHFWERFGKAVAKCSFINIQTNCLQQ